MWMVVVAVLAQSEACRFKADWWLTTPVEMQTSRGITFGTMPGRSDRDVPAVKAEVVFRGERAEVTVAHRGVRLKFFSSELFALVDAGRVPCSDLRLGSPTPVHEAEVRSGSPEVLPAEAGARTAALLHSQVEATSESPLYAMISRRRAPVKTQVCRSALKLFAVSGEEVGELVGAPFSALGEGARWVEVRLDGAFETSQLFVKRAELDECRALVH